MKEVNCVSPCSVYEYQVVEFLESGEKCSEWYCKFIPLHVITVQDSNLYSSKEYFIYDINSFIADFGGYLGLLLGASVITLYEWIVGTVQTLVLKVTKGHKKIW